MSLHAQFAFSPAMHGVYYRRQAAQITTRAITNNTSGTSATGNATITAAAGVTVSTNGVCWNTTGTPTTADSKSSTSSGTGSFSYTISGLSPGKTYFVRAYAIVGSVTYYGNPMDFTTPQGFNYTNSIQTYVVPDNVYMVNLDVYGAKGGDGYFNAGGNGGYASGSLSVTPGQVLTVYVGGQGQAYAWSTRLSAFGGGGKGGPAGADGGGASDVRIGAGALTDRVIVAAGGGGAGFQSVAGGAGGGLVGTDGGYANRNVYVPGGLPGRQDAGGAGGAGTYPGTAGTLGLGGNGGRNGAGGNDYSGGGGGGYYGGGGGAGDPTQGGGDGGGGGGGSSYIGGVSNGVTTSGARSGNGYVLISRTTSLTFNYSGSPQTIRIPQNVTSVKIEAYGAQGGNGYSNPGGNGGYASGNLGVTPGDVLTVYVGGQGQAYSWSTRLSAFGGGGRGGPAGGDGGGASDVRIGAGTLTDRVIVAAGGGGAGFQSVAGGAGGGLVGVAGGYANVNVYVPGGLPGRQDGGGAGGTGTYPGTAGTLGLGGDGGRYSTGGNDYSGGGGGGYYGGGGGAGDPLQRGGDGGGGGGGSSYIGGVTNGVTSAGQRAGNGIVIISW